MRPDPKDNLAQRPTELEDWLNAHIYHPLARKLALALRHTFVTPNMVSAAGFVSIVAAALVYGAAERPAWAALALAIHMTWHVFDGADGDLARLTGRVSPMGEIVDGLSDYAGHLALYVALGFVLVGQIGANGWGLVAVAAVARIVQACFFETHRRQYQWWAYRQPWLGAGLQDEHPNSLLKWFATPYLALTQIFMRNSGPIDECLDRCSETQRTDAIATIRREYGPFLARLGILSANYRTIALGLSMLAGTPLYFFLFEAALLTLAWIGLWFDHRRTQARILAQLPDRSSR